MNEKQTQTENQIARLQILKIQNMLWTITAVSSFMGLFLLVLRVVLYPKLFSAWVVLIMLTEVLIFIRAGKSCEELDRKINSSK